ncbi:MAG: Tim44 domain-containing protein, partial [Chitinophagaceae bacterium]|nr:Tim44 domain-containing protein [Rubrivivax sp.]
MKNWLNGTLAVATMAVVAVTSLGLPGPADAKRLGGGSSQGLNRNMPARTAPDA